MCRNTIGRMPKDASREVIDLVWPIQSLRQRNGNRMSEDYETAPDYCPRCEETVAVKEQEFTGGTKWVCTLCGYTIDCDYDDEETFPAPLNSP